MSNVLAIAATTASLQGLLHRAGIANVSVHPPDTAGKDTTSHVNLFLFQATIDGSLRNTDMPGQVKRGETGNPPIPVTLYYLITAYGKDDDDTEGHKLLGRAMSVLHDHCLLGRQEIIDATATEVDEQDLKSDLHDQVERIRITPHPMTVEEMSKLWTTFQAGYRISVSYQVSVVLIESKRPTLTPLPVLTRGVNDRGVLALAGIVPPFPTIESIKGPDDDPGVLPGKTIEVIGHHLLGDADDPTAVSVAVRLTTRRLLQPFDIDVMADSQNSVGSELIRVKIPDLVTGLPPGLYTLSVRVTPTGAPLKMKETNEIPFLISPLIGPPMPRTIQLTNVQGGSGSIAFNVTVKPRVRYGQRVSFLLGSQEFPGTPVPDKPADPPAIPETDTFAFKADNVAAGKYFVRLRVDGVDSHLIDRTDAKNPKFNAGQIFEITV